MKASLRVIGLAAICLIITSWAVMTAPRRSRVEWVALHPTFQDTSGDSSPALSPIRIQPEREIVLPPAAGRPQFIAVSGTACRVVVGDPSTRSVHLFDFSGRLVATFDGDGRAPRILSSLSALTIAPDGEVIVGDALENRLVVLTPDELRVTDIVELRDGVGTYAPAALAIRGRSDLVVVGQSAASEFVSGEPPIRVVDRAGKVMLYFDGIAALPGGAFASVNSSRLVATAGDSLIVANTLDGSIAVYGISSRLMSAEPLRLPRLFRAKPLRYSVRRTAGSSDPTHMVAPAPHFLALAADPIGNWFVVQELSSPRDRARRSAAQSNVIVAVRVHDRGNLSYFALGGRVISIAADGPLLFALVEQAPSAVSAAKYRRLLSFRNPLLNRDDLIGWHSC